MNTEKELLPDKLVMDKIYFIRNQKVMLDRDLAGLYGVETRVLNQAVKRNISRFPEDFMFQMTLGEQENWKSQIVTSNKEKMGMRKPPLVLPSKASPCCLVYLTAIGKLWSIYRL
ncbi:MAG: ORF6N domain-containing protein [Cyclobacteriaceae bacterium]|nr:ORF6N domain-containing protein [Cyclobacteriaceae bacterium]